MDGFQMKDLMLQEVKLIIGGLRNQEDKLKREREVMYWDLVELEHAGCFLDPEDLRMDL